MLALFAAAGLIMSFVGLMSGLDAQKEQDKINEDSLALQTEQLELQKETNEQQERQDILSQANAAAMNIDNLNQSVREAGFYQRTAADDAAQLTTERNDALNSFDVGATKTKGSQRVAQALSGAKLTTGTNNEVAASTAKNLESDRSALQGNYNKSIQNHLNTSKYYSESASMYNKQVSSYNTLLTDIYNSNSDWLTPESAGSYGGAYGDWLKKRKK